MILSPFVHNEINARLRDEETHICADPNASSNFLKDIVKSEIAIKNPNPLKKELVSIAKGLLTISKADADLHHDILHLLAGCLLSVIEEIPADWRLQNELSHIILCMCAYADLMNKGLEDKMNNFLKERSERAQGIYAARDA